MNYHLLIISNAGPNSVWLQEMTTAWREIGTVTAVSEGDIPQHPQSARLHLIVIDASAIATDLVNLVAWLQQLYPDIPIVVTTTSPTWDLARQIFLAGASDYLHRSLEMDTIVKAFLDIIQQHRPEQEIEVE
jgi:DNA-binding NarL/FixJ family response regulator